MQYWLVVEDEKINLLQSDLPVNLNPERKKYIKAIVYINSGSIRVRNTGIPATSTTGIIYNEHTSFVLEGILSLQQCSIQAISSNVEVYVEYLTLRS